MANVETSSLSTSSILSSKFHTCTYFCRSSISKQAAGKKYEENRGLGTLVGYMLGQYPTSLT